MTLDFDSLVGAGTAIGSAAVIVIDDRCCMVQLAVRVSQFYEHESCGKCTPCRVGTKWLTEILQKIEDGRGTQADMDLLVSVAERINGKCLCPLGDSDAIAVMSYFDKFRDEFQAHIDEGGCPFHGDLVPRRPAGAGCHAHPPRGTGARMTDLVKVTDRRPRGQVPKGTGLVETAAAAGIEIPVFCYEPRLGPAVGACRMCLVEVEGLPKLQAGCSLGAAGRHGREDGGDLGEGAEGQDATLEFILVNHPLDCPVCDKGGECPLQDLTFRYGPGNTRMTFPKITLEKPIPVSPLIALDRERCILCYRCTRFSSDVAEDNQLVARNRGAHTEIATFESDPYRAPFSGNVIELCPVGALTSTQYRFEARPWDIQNVPTVCGLCAGRLQRQRDGARGEGEADPLAQPPRDRRGLALRQGALLVPAPHGGGPDHRAARARPARARAARLGRGARPRRGAAARGRHEHRHRALRHRRRSSRRTRSAACCARGLGAHAAVLPESTSDALERVPAAALGAGRRPSSWSSSATTRSPSARRSSTCG